MKDDFEPFPSLQRYFRGVITEKIDGTNAQVWISEDGKTLRAGSRKRWITPEADNFGFAVWCEENRTELLRLGPGRHFGEWWGRGIQRGYDLDERRFSLFDTKRWHPQSPELPSCCHVVPILERGKLLPNAVDVVMQALASHGSVAAPGFARPEGVVLFSMDTGAMTKTTFERNQSKWQLAAA